VLVTNDDGVTSPGLHTLASALAEAGHEVIVVAPASDCSGQGAAVGPLHVTGKIQFERVGLPGTDIEAVAVDGPPALCVMAACLGGFGAAPEMVVSGINLGSNTGRAVLHSGTVGAALTGLNFGQPGIAVSQQAGETQLWLSAASLAVSLVERVAARSEALVFSLNVPNAGLSSIPGLEAATLDTGGTVQSALVEREAGVLEFRFPTPRPPRPGTDNQLLAAGYATVTALCGPQAVTLDDWAFIEGLLPAARPRRDSA